MSAQVSPQVETNENGEVELVKWATLDLIREAVERKKLAPHHTHTDKETGLSFEFRELTGQDMDRVASWAGGDEDKYGQILIETASVKPKIDMLMWEGLGMLSPMVRINILQFVRRTSRLLAEEMDDAKND